MAWVVSRGEPFELLLKKFKRACEREGIMKQYNLSKLPPKEKRKYKQFVSERRRIKKMKRIQRALERTADLKVIE